MAKLNPVTLYPDKQIVIAKILEHLSKEKDLYGRIAAQARLDAIDTELKQEGKYDTRAIEASYLAGAQKRRLEEIIVEIQNLKSLDQSTHHTSVALGTLVLLTSQADQKQWYFLSPTTGGLDVCLESVTVKVISIHSPLARALVGLNVGDEVLESQGVPKSLSNTEVTEIL